MPFTACKNSVWVETYEFLKFDKYRLRLHDPKLGILYLRILHSSFIHEIEAFDE